jgi:hypothetical protein
VPSAKFPLRLEGFTLVSICNANLPGATQLNKIKLKQLCPRGCYSSAMNEQDELEFKRALELSHANQLAGESLAMAAFEAWLTMESCNPLYLDRLQAKPARYCGCAVCQRAFLEAR